MHTGPGVPFVAPRKSVPVPALRLAVSGEATWPGGQLEIYIQPHPIIRRMTLSETMDALDNIRKSNPMSSEFFVEAVAYQQAAIEERSASRPCVPSRTSARSFA